MKTKYTRSRLWFAITAGLLVLASWGCSQREDIVTPISRSELTLQATSLPSPPSGLMYELWISGESVVDTGFDLNQARSLGRFSYINNDSINSFLDTNGKPRSATFEMQGDFRSYRSVFVSLQRADDPAGTRPGAIMLIAYIPGLLDIPIKMLFPQADSLWMATCRYNMEGISDRNRAAGDGHGIWFASYRSVIDTIPDTVGLTVDSSRIDTMKPVICGTPPDTCNKADLQALYPSSIKNVRTETVRLTFPNDTLILDVDSFMHTHIVFDVNYRKDTTYPYTKKRLIFNYSDTGFVIPRVAILDIFTQDNFALPIISEWGWKYGGWVVSGQLPINGSIGSLTPPAWRYNTAYRNWLPGSNGGLISTGTFDNINGPDDDGNPYALNTYLPPFPGEDFLNTSALQSGLGIDSVNLTPAATGNSGTVFISVEPKNRLVTNTNFPLIPFVSEIPRRLDSITKSTVLVPMINSTSTLLGNEVYTFPMVEVKVKRF